jgi:hypothetical protein
VTNNLHLPKRARNLSWKGKRGKSVGDIGKHSCQSKTGIKISGSRKGLDITPKAQSPHEVTDNRRGCLPICLP